MIESRCGEKESDLGLATITIILGSVWTIKNMIDCAAASLEEFPLQIAMNIVENSFGNNSPSNHRLIRDYYYQGKAPCYFSDLFASSWNHSKLFGGFHVIGSLVIQGPVSIDKNRPD